MLNRFKNDIALIEKDSSSWLNALLFFFFRILYQRDVHEEILVGGEDEIIAVARDYPKSSLDKQFIYIFCDMNSSSGIHPVHST